MYTCTHWYLHPYKRQFNPHTPVQIYTFKLMRRYTFICSSTCSCGFVYMYANIHTYIQPYTNTQTHIHTPTRVQVCAHMRAYVYLFTHINMDAYISINYSSMNVTRIHPQNIQSIFDLSSCDRSSQKRFFFYPIGHFPHSHWLKGSFADSGE